MAAVSCSLFSSLLQSQTRSIRLLHVCRTLAAVDKGNLAKLRKKTGFSMSNCKKALEMHENDLAKAESWLQAEAQAQGWAKATKLAGRTTAQGLIGIHIEDNVGAMVEVNCETDFVARNEKFKALVSQVAKECASGATPLLEHGLKKEMMAQEQMKDIPTSEGKKLGDLVALAIGSVGENMSLARGTRLVGGPGVQLIGYSHPSTPDDDMLVGKFGAILALRSTGELTETARQLCVHIVGMNPKEVGKLSDPKAPNNDDETLLVHQEFLSDPSKTVSEVIQEEQLEIVDFVRFQCGELNKAEE